MITKESSNYSKFIERPVTHAETCHKAVLQEMKEDTTQKKSSSATKTRVSKKDISYLVEKKTAKPTMGHESGHTSITTKYNRKMQCLTAKSDTVAERFAKSHCLMMIHAGVNKNIMRQFMRCMIHR